MGGIALQHGTVRPQAIRELRACLDAGEQLRQSARSVADAFYDTSDTEIGRRVSGRLAVDRWVDERESWIGYASNLLRDLLAGSEAADVFRRVASAPESADAPFSPEAKLDRHLNALDRALDDLRRIEAQLRSAPQQSADSQVENLPGTGTPVPSHSSTAGQAAAPPHGSVFLVHGRNERVKVDVARTLEKTGDRNVVILHEVPDRGRTIIEKFEDEASSAAYAVIL